MVNERIYTEFPCSLRREGGLCCWSRSFQVGAQHLRRRQQQRSPSS